MAFILSGIAIGAAMGGGMAALQHKDIMQGALYGGIGGALTGGIGGAMGGLGGSAAADLGSSAITEGGIDTLAGGMATNGVAPTLSSQAAGEGAFGIGNAGTFGSGTPGSLPLLDGGNTTSGVMNFLGNNKYALGAGALGGMMAQNTGQPTQTNPGQIDPYTYSAVPNPKYTGPGTAPLVQHYTAGTPYPAAANGGIVAMADGGIAGLGSNPIYPGANTDHTQYATSSQLPASAAIINSDYDAATDPYTGNEVVKSMATGGISSLGGYSDGGHLLKGPGDGVSDSIPAQIGNKQPARLADGEFVVPARVVSELGNGSTDAGAKRLYTMMNNVQASRKKSMGKGNVAVDTKAARHLPA